MNPAVQIDGCYIIRDRNADINLSGIRFIITPDISIAGTPLPI